MKINIQPTVYFMKGTGKEWKLFFKAKLHVCDSVGIELLYELLMKLSRV